MNCHSSLGWLLFWFWHLFDDFQIHVLYSLELLPTEIDVGKKRSACSLFVLCVNEGWANVFLDSNSLVVANNFKFEPKCADLFV